MHSEKEGEHPVRIRTPQGVVHFKMPTVEQMERLSELLPLGLKLSGGEGGALRYGLVLASGREELRFLKQQPVEIPPSSAAVVMRANQILIASSIAQYLSEEASGLFWPIQYQRNKPQGVEAGIAYTGWGFDPNPEGFDPVATAFDDDFSPGFTRAMMAFVEILKAESQVTGITLQPCIGLDVRPCSALGGLSLGLLVLDQEVFCLKTELSEQDPIWTILRSQGIDTLIHLPSWPLAL